MSKSIFKMNFWSNWYVILSMASSAFLAFSTIYIPFLRNLFHTTLLSMNDWIKIILISITIILVIEIDKMIRIRREKIA